ncbi:hypothetical protein [Bacillus taeanensis]|uniref:Uncharacterized protein n=1 Tax=Bacillus taeanensis TaxID=273032 RepID=A0A366XV17_9BACI|nr:hypothetical protein [Bacillus taeanensis]RBW69747.1 hypothetical protein DS031_09445 [Bacillus taeanensis]
MSVILHILYNHIILLVLMISIGIMLQKKYSFNVKIFAKLMFVLFIPVLIFKEIVEVEIDVQIVGKIF